MARKNDKICETEKRRCRGRIRQRNKGRENHIKRNKRRNRGREQLRKIEREEAKNRERRQRKRETERNGSN